MTLSRWPTTSVLSVALVMMACSLAAAGPANAATCTPTTRILDTLPVNAPLVISQRGHVVTREGEPGATSGLWLHRLNGGSTPITYANGTSPSVASDVNGRGAAVGTDGVDSGAIAPGVPWISQGGTASHLPNPTRAEPTYFAVSINSHGAVAGVATNYPYDPPTGTAFTAIPLLWSSADANPTDLSMPAGVFVVGFDQGSPLLDIRNDGAISAVLLDKNGSGTYLARWATPTAAPTLVAIPRGLAPVAVAGRWVVGQVGQDMFVFSPQAAVVISTAEPLFDMSVAANGTYTAMRDGVTVDYGIVGRGTTAPRDASQYYALADVAGSMGGQVALESPSSTSVLTCALGLPALSGVDVTPVVLG